MKCVEMLSHNNFILYDVYRGAGDNSDRPMSDQLDA